MNKITSKLLLAVSSKNFWRHWSEINFKHEKYNPEVIIMHILKMSDLIRIEIMKYWFSTDCKLDYDLGQKAKKKNTLGS